MSLTPPVQTADCFITLRGAVGQVPAVLQITSYPGPQSESFPSIYLRAVAPAGKLRDLIEQPLAAKMFVLRKTGGPVWETPDGEPAQITIKTIDGTRAIGSILSATLVDHGTGEQQSVTGRFDGAVR